MERKLIASRLEDVREAIDELVSRVEEMEYGEKDVFAIRLALEEALTNAIIHGNKNDPRRHVLVEHELTPRQIKICVTDEGEGFDPCSIPDPTAEENLLAPCGRGIFLMRQFMDNVSFNPKGNCITLVKRRPAGGKVHDVEARVVSAERFHGRYCRLRLEAREIAEWIRPGQFVNVVAGESKERRGSFDDWEDVREALGRKSGSRDVFLRRPFSLHRLHRYEDGEPDGTLSILFEVVGPGTEALWKLKAGEKARMLGPLGKPVDLDRHSELPLVLLAGGMGLAPMPAIAEEARRHGRETVLLAGASERRHLPARLSPSEGEGPSLDEFDELDVEVRLVTEADDGLRTGLATDLLLEYLGVGGRRCEVLACGPKEMLKEAAGMCRAYEVPCQVLMEEMMGCGFGGCMSCSVLTKSGPARVCVDGPAFDAEEIAWEGAWPRST